MREIYEREIEGREGVERETGWRERLRVRDRGERRCREIDGGRWRRERVERD